MSAFLAVSIAPNAAERLRHPVEAAIACLADGGSVEHRDVAADGWIASTEPVGPGAFTVSLSKLLRTRDADLSHVTVTREL